MKSTPFMETPILSYNLGVALLKNPPAGATKAAQLLQQSQAPLTAMLRALSSPGGKFSRDLRDEKPIKVIWQPWKITGKSWGKKHRKPSNSTENQGKLRNIIQKINGHHWKSSNIQGRSQINHGIIHKSSTFWSSNIWKSSENIKFQAFRLRIYMDFIWILWYFNILFCDWKSDGREIRPRPGAWWDFQQLGLRTGSD